MTNWLRPHWVPCFYVYIVCLSVSAVFFCVTDICRDSCLYMHVPLHRRLLLVSFLFHFLLLVGNEIGAHAVDFPFRSYTIAHIRLRKRVCCSSGRSRRLTCFACCFWSVSRILSLSLSLLLWLWLWLRGVRIVVCGVYVSERARQRMEWKGQWLCAVRARNQTESISGFFIRICSHLQMEREIRIRRQWILFHSSIYIQSQQYLSFYTIDPVSGIGIFNFIYEK